MHSEHVEVHIQPCPGLVQLIEQGKADSQACLSLLKQFVEPLKEKQIDTVVLGCTHYPFVANQIASLLDKHTQIIETAMPVTNELVRRLENNQLLNKRNDEKVHYFFTQELSTAQQHTLTSLWQGLGSITATPLPLGYE